MSNYLSAEAPALLDRAELGAWRGLLRVHSRMTKALDAELIAEHGISLSSYEVLLFLADAPDGQLRMSELADGVLLSRSGLTRLVDRMERDGLLRRERCEDDARGFNALITAEGRDLFRERPAHPPRRRARAASSATSPPTSCATLARLWEKVAPGAAG